MLTIPVGKQTFKRDFLDGKGNLQLDLDGGGVNPAEPFPDSVSKLVTFRGTANPSLEFGTAEAATCKVNFSAGATNGIELIWPNTDSAFLTDRGLPAVPAGQVGAHLFLEATAGSKVSGAMPAGPATFSFGIQAGGAVGYDRFMLYDGGTTAGGILRELVTNLRLPFGCGAGDRLPLANEILAFQYRGFLALTAGLNWGYQLTGHQGIDYRDLHAAIEYDVRLKAGIEFGYRIGGEFSVEVRQGHAERWIRVTVRKKNSSELNAAASFSLDAATTLAGVPESADEFLIAVMGADAKSALALFAKIRTLSDLKALEAEAGKLLLGRLKTLSHAWLGKALDNESVTEFLAIVDRVVTEYDQLEDTVAAQLTVAMHLFEDYLGKGQLDVLEQALEKVAGLGSRAGLTTLADTEAWKVIDRLVGGDLFKVMQGNEAFAEVTGVAQRALGFVRGDFPELRDLVTELKTSFSLDRIFGELRQWATKDKLLALADDKLQGVVEKLLGRAWSAIDTHNVAEVAKRLNHALDKAEDFKNVWFRRMREAANQSFSLQLNLAYKRAKADQALIDVEIDLASSRGPELFEAAVHGRFSEVFARPNLPALVVHHGQLSHTLTKSTQTSISVFGWSSKHLVEVMAKTENLVQAGPTGEVQVFMTEVAVKERQEKKGRDKTTETVESNFLMRFTGEVFLPDGTGTPERAYLIRAVNNMATEYNLQLTDDETTFEEMEAYLALAERVGLIPSSARYLKELKAQFPKGLGKANIRYVVAFDNDGIRDAFSLPGAEAADIARQVTRGLVRAQIVTGRPLTHDLTVIGLVYLQPAVQALFESEGENAVRGRTWTISVGGSKRTLNKDLNVFVNRLLQMERNIANRLEKLDKVVDQAREGARPVPEKDLEDAALKFVECAADLNGATPGTDRVNTFFAVFDALVAAGSRGKGYRESTMVIELQANTPEKVTKYLLA